MCVLCVSAGVLYSLLGRNLDTGEAAPYTDEHWRGVVTRLHLTTQQVGDTLLCALVGSYVWGLLGSVVSQPNACSMLAVCHAGG